LTCTWSATAHCPLPATISELPAATYL
jgi:hypothetical protein